MPPVRFNAHGLGTRLVLALTMAFLIGSLLHPEVGATKRAPVVSVSKRVETMRDVCELVGRGILTVEKVGKSTVTQCNGGTSDGQRCVISKTSTKCHQTVTAQPTGQDAGSPPGGDAGVVTDPTGGHVRGPHAGDIGQGDNAPIDDTPGPVLR
ncbi:MAG: hypothetical protein U0031_15030 [Thermomicrobiales bacterium]